jgi:hypothetical protein
VTQRAEIVSLESRLVHLVGLQRLGPMPAPGQRLDEGVLSLVLGGIEPDPLPSDLEGSLRIIRGPQRGKPPASEVPVETGESEARPIRPMLELRIARGMPSLQEMALVQGKGLRRRGPRRSRLELPGIDEYALRDPQAVPLRDDPVLAQLSAQEMEGLIQGVPGAVGRKPAPEQSLDLVPRDVTLHGKEDEERRPGGLRGKPGVLLAVHQYVETTQGPDLDRH